MMIFSPMKMKRYLTNERGEVGRVLMYLGVFAGIWFTGSLIFGCIHKEKLRRMGVDVDGTSKVEEVDPGYTGPPTATIEVPL